MKGGAGEGIEDSGKENGGKGNTTQQRSCDNKGEDDGEREHTHDLIYRGHDRMSRMRPVESMDTWYPSICTSAYSDPHTRSQQLWLRSVVSRILRIRTSTRSVFLRRRHPPTAPMHCEQPVHKPKPPQHV